MSNQLDPKELARIKRLARAERISRIRRAAAVTGVSLAAVFSGMVLVRTELDQPAATTTAQVTESAVASEPESSGDGQGDHEDGLVGVIAGVVDNTLGGSTTQQSAPAASAPAPAPLTTSQS